jgi:transposase
VWSKRHRDLGRTRTQVVCRLHAVLCGLVPGGVPKAIIAAHAARLLDSVAPADAVAAARCELAAAFLEDLRRIDAQLRDTKKRLTLAVRAAGTSLTGLFGVGPVIAATLIGGTGDVSRVPTPAGNLESDCHAKALDRSHSFRDDRPGRACAAGFRPRPCS